MIEEIFTDLAPLAEKRGITLEQDGDGVMTGSDALIYRLLFNLTGNAIKYNRTNGSVLVCVTREDTNIHIYVTDTGCGIPAEFQRSIFQPFFRVDKSRSREYGGAGLGLSLVWEIADLHGGSVQVAESSKQGSTASGAERAYRKAVDKLTELLVAEGALHAVAGLDRYKTLFTADTSASIELWIISSLIPTPQYILSACWMPTKAAALDEDPMEIACSSYTEST